MYTKLHDANKPKAMKSPSLNRGKYAAVSIVGSTVGQNVNVSVFSFVYTYFQQKSSQLQHNFLHFLSSLL